MVNFWASWCAPCRIEMPHLNKLHDKYRAAGLKLLGVNVDEDATKAVGTASKWGVKFPVLLDADKKVSRLYDLNSMPTTVLIDRDGKVAPPAPRLPRRLRNHLRAADPRTAQGMS